MVSTPMASSDGASRFHSFFASGSSHAGRLSVALGGTGSFVFSSGRLPGLPSSCFSVISLGYLPLTAMGFTSLRNNWDNKKNAYCFADALA